MNHTPQNWLSFLLPFVVIGVVMTLRMRRMAAARPLKLEYMWVVPALYAVIAALVFSTTPPATATAWLACAVALVVGCGLGWQRGRMMHISVDPATGTLRQRGSLAAIAFILVLIALRTAAREAVQFGGLPLDIKAMTDVLIALALGLLTVQRVEMYLRAKRLLGEQRTN